jgi:hypothetical protein
MVVLFHGYHHRLSWCASGRAMLDTYAHRPVYLNVGYGNGCSNRWGANFRRVDRLQVGGRRWCYSLQRPTPPERDEGGVEGAADLHGAEDHEQPRNKPERGAGLFFFETGSVLHELLDHRADQRPDVHEHVDGERRRGRVAADSPGRHGGCHHGRPEGSGCSSRRRSVHDLAGGSGHSFDTSHDPGRPGQFDLPVLERDFPRSSALESGASAARPSALTLTDTAAAADYRSGSRRVS